MEYMTPDILYKYVKVFIDSYKNRHKFTLGYFDAELHVSIEEDHRFSVYLKMCKKFLGRELNVSKYTFIDNIYTDGINKDMKKSKDIFTRSLDKLLCNDTDDMSSLFLIHYDNDGLSYTLSQRAKLWMNNYWEGVFFYEYDEYYI